MSDCDYDKRIKEEQDPERWNDYLMSRDKGMPEDVRTLCSLSLIVKEYYLKKKEHIPYKSRKKAMETYLLQSIEQATKLLKNLDKIED